MFSEPGRWVFSTLQLLTHHVMAGRGARRGTLAPICHAARLHDFDGH